MAIDVDVFKRVPVREQDASERAHNFEEVCYGYNAEEAMAEASRCIGCKNAPCMGGCPVSINIPGFIAKVKEGNFAEAFQIISESSALPAVCGRVCPQETQCEHRCIRGIKGEAVSIGKLERFVADWARENGIKPTPAAQKNGKKVAVIGSGPAGLTCAGDLAKLGYDVTIFEALHEAGVKLILMRCAGFNNVDLKTAAKYGIDVRRVPGYSPEAVAEHAMTLAMTVNRHMHKAYTKVRENDFSLGGLMGFNFYQKTAGIVGTGKIGAAMARICRGFGMKVIAYDVYQNESLKDFVTYVTLDELLAQSDLISLHCPLMDSTYHMINRESIKKMKDGVILVNTSRGGLVKTDDLIEGIRARKFFGVGLDVYEEETPNVFEDRSDEILEHSTTARLLSFPNVMITSHQGFFTEEALRAIAETTLQNALDFEAGKETPNIVRA